MLVPEESRESPQQRFEALGEELPPPTVIPPQFSFRAARRHGNLLFLSGHGPNGKKMPPEFDYQGKVGAELTAQEGYAAARLVGLSLLRSVQRELGSLDRVAEIMEVLGAVNSAPGFTGQSAVLNGCTDLFVQIFGEEVGKPARMAFGAAELPFNMAAEIRMTVAVRHDTSA